MAAEQAVALEAFKNEYNEKKKVRLQEIKDKYNALSQKINVDTSELTQAIQKKRLQDKELQDKLDNQA